MDQLIIEGGRALSGTLNVSGSKNATLPILMASLLCKEPCVFEGVPQLRDTKTLLKIMEVLGADVKHQGSRLTVTSQDQGPIEAPYELVSTQRASFYALGALLGRRRQACVSLPGGCVIGLRPVDLHLKGFEALGVSLKVEGGYIKADARGAQPGRVFLGGPFGSSVGATCNVLMLASTLKGTTYIDHAACEPEVASLCHFLNACGAKIQGIGSPYLKITGVESLKGIQFTMPQDRIEAATFLVLACLSVGQNLAIQGIDLKEHGALLDILKQTGYLPSVVDEGIAMKKVSEALPIECTTLPYPGFPTDCQAQLMVLLTQFPHLSVITERVYPDRFMHTAELQRMGATIRKEGASALITGGRTLSGAQVMASDLRASAALVLAGLVAQGTTTISRVYHIDRGYERLDEKLQSVGASIERKKQ